MFAHRPLPFPSSTSLSSSPSCVGHFKLGPPVLAQGPASYSVVVSVKVSSFTVVVVVRPRLRPRPRPWNLDGSRLRRRRRRPVVASSSSLSLSCLKVQTVGASSLQAGAVRHTAAQTPETKCVVGGGGSRPLLSVSQWPRLRQATALGTAVVIIVVVLAELGETSISLTCAK
jgi:hypothetical protein